MVKRISFDDTSVDFSSFDAAIFDLDGTLVHSEHVWERAKREVLASYDIQVDPSLFHAHIGRGLKGFLDDAFGRSLNAQEHEEIGNKIGARADLLLPGHRTPVEGAADFLRSLHDSGVRIAICSSSPMRHIHSAIEFLSIQQQVELCVSGADLPRGKPDPLPYNETLRRLDVVAQRACAFEDSVSGIRSALSAELAVFEVVGPSTIQ
ncbi:HAD family hydrolase [Ruegeria atlantica]|uniref:HAD family hydrolase n=1 Tax=Ruegeria atlantica TaxID=81569 RepID=UPI0014815839|nr:HAD family phosphatase [Ruegeria atlantica]